MIVVVGSTALTIRGARWRPVPVMCTPSEESEEAYLARHPTLKADLLAALDHALSSRADDPRRAIADHLRGAPPTPAVPAPSQCPTEGVQFSGRLVEREQTWVLWWNQFCNLDFTNENILSGLPLSELPQSSYPVRMSASAGFRRDWSLPGGGDSTIGDQTTTNLRRVDPVCETGRAHAMVGVLVPLSERCFEVARNRLILRGMAMEKLSVRHLEWLGWMDMPMELAHVWVPVPRPIAGPVPFPTFDLPILQSHVDTIMLGALAHGELFAAEWLESIEAWSSFWLNDRLSSRRPWVHLPQAPQIDRLLRLHPPADRNMYTWRAHASEYTLRSGRPHCGGAMTVDEALPLTFSPRRVARNFLVGFGSLLQTASRRRSNHAAVDAAPCRIRREFGYVREWNFQSPTAQICALGLRRVEIGEIGSTINGVIFPAPDDLSEFDKRENGYQRVQVPRDMLELIGWQTLPRDACIYVYVPFAPAVLAKCGVDSCGLPRCYGPEPPEGIDETREGCGRGLLSPSVKHPILQTYVDVCVSGCLEHGDEFAREFIQTTFKWSPYWLNEREMARRPWLYQEQYMRIDKLLAELLPDYYRFRKLDSEYATLLIQDPSTANNATKEC